MNDSNISSSRNELLFVIIFALLSTIIMASLGAFKRLYLFALTFHHAHFGEFAVFFPAFLAIGFIYFSYRRIRDLEIEITGRKQAEEALRFSEERYKVLSRTDELTQLYNSRHFYDTLTVEIDRAFRYGHPLSLLLLDIDNFKNYNDTYGHQEGDKVLAKLGEILLESIRFTDTAFRYGGEEFTVILPETKGEGAVIVAERIRERFEARAFSPKPDVHAHNTVSIGVTQRNTSEAMESLIKRADMAMYDGKEKGKNQVIFFPQEKEEVIY